MYFYFCIKELEIVNISIIMGVVITFRREPSVISENIVKLFKMVCARGKNEPNINLMAAWLGTGGVGGAIVARGRLEAAADMNTSYWAPTHQTQRLKGR